MSTDDNTPPLEAFTDPATEARLAAMLLGEASDFERAELEDMLAEQPDLRAAYRRLEEIDSLLSSSETLDTEVSPATPWKLSTERRSAVLESFASEPTTTAEGGTTVATRSGGFPRWPWLSAVAAVFLLCLAVPMLLTRTKFEGKDAEMVAGAASKERRLGDSDASAPVSYHFYEDLSVDAALTPESSTNEEIFISNAAAPPSAPEPPSTPEPDSTWMAATDPFSSKIEQKKPSRAGSEDVKSGEATLAKVSNRETQSLASIAQLGEGKQALEWSIVSGGMPALPNGGDELLGSVTRFEQVAGEGRQGGVHGEQASGIIGSYNKNSYFTAADSDLDVADSRFRRDFAKAEAPPKDGGISGNGIANGAFGLGGTGSGGGFARPKLEKLSDPNDRILGSPDASGAERDREVNGYANGVTSPEQYKWSLQQPKGFDRFGEAVNPPQNALRPGQKGVAAGGRSQERYLSEKAPATHWGWQDELQAKGKPNPTPSAEAAVAAAESPEFKAGYRFAVPTAKPAKPQTITRRKSGQEGQDQAFGDLASDASELSNSLMTRLDVRKNNRLTAAGQPLALNMESEAKEKSLELLTALNEPDNATKAWDKTRDSRSAIEDEQIPAWAIVDAAKTTELAEAEGEAIRSLHLSVPQTREVQLFREMQVLEEEAREIDELEVAQERLTFALKDTADLAQTYTDLGSAIAPLADDVTWWEETDSKNVTLFDTTRSLESADGEQSPVTGRPIASKGRTASLATFQSPRPASGPEENKRIVDFKAALDLEIATTEEPFSTFSLNVSDVSYKLAQAALLENGSWPEADKIRPEEFVNALDYTDPAPAPGEAVSSATEQCVHPFLPGRNLLRVSMQTAATGRAASTPLRLTVLLDKSGSMEREDREASVAKAMEALAAQLKEGDEITVIGFARTPRLIADRLPGKDAGKLAQLVDDAPSEGGTNLEEALRLAEEKAHEQFLEGAMNRIVLITDGAANLGDASPDSLQQKIIDLRDKGLAFDACGVGADGLNDEILESLTRKGDGRYYFLDRPEDADEGFVRQLAGALRPAARNVKVQVKFNPQRVASYRLSGFEKHRLKKEDFRNDKVDAAELAAAESGNAIYQIEVDPAGQGNVGEVFVRFQDLSSGEMVERSWPIPYQPSAPSLGEAERNMKSAALAAIFAEKLKGGSLGEMVNLDELAPIAAPLRGTTAKIDTLIEMIEKARQLAP